MAIGFFYLSLAGVLIIFFICAYLKGINFADAVIGITAAAYSLTFDNFFGEYLRLYHYIDLIRSPLYLTSAGLFMYSFLNVIYIMFLPKKTTRILLYTSAWIAAMLVHEYLSVVTKSIVFTGWKPMPWSIVTYIVTYLWVYYLYKYLAKSGLAEIWLIRAKNQ